MLGMKILNFRDGQLFVYFQLFIFLSQINHLEASNTETAQSKGFWNECLESNNILSHMAYPTEVVTAPLTIAIAISSSL